MEDNMSDDVVKVEVYVTYKRTVTVPDREPISSAIQIANQEHENGKIIEINAKILK
jgi:hypothetical protein